MGWAKYSHEQIGINSFGASAPFKQVYAKFGITAESALKLFILLSPLSLFLDFVMTH
jgi:transketolase